MKRLIRGFKRLFKRNSRVSPDVIRNVRIAMPGLGRRIKLEKKGKNYGMD